MYRRFRRCASCLTDPGAGFCDDQWVPGYAVIDTETTGFSPRDGDRVLEIAVVHLDEAGRVEAQWETLLNPRRGVGATHVHGLTAADVAPAPDFVDVAEYVADLLAGRVVVGHNIAFDLRFLVSEFELAQRPLSPVESLCTQGLAASYLPGPKRTLAVCCEQAGVVNAHAHSALGDTLATAELFQHFLRQHPQGAPWHGQVLKAAEQTVGVDDLFSFLAEPVQPPARVLTRSSAGSR